MELKVNAGKIIGGIIVLVGAAFFVIQTFISVDEFGYAPWLINLAFSLAAVIAGVFGMIGQRGAAILAVIVGLLCIVFGLLSVLLPDYRLWQYSLIADTLGGVRLQGMTIEGFLIVMGGIELSLVPGD
jgi:hypothetical protein